MPSVFIEELKERPATVAHIIFMVLIWLYQFDYHTPAEKFGQEYGKQIYDREWWRCLTSIYSHLGLMHIIFNMLALWALGVCEAVVSTAEATVACTAAVTVTPRSSLLHTWLCVLLSAWHALLPALHSADGGADQYTPAGHAMVHSAVSRRA